MSKISKNRYPQRKIDGFHFKQEISPRTFGQEFYLKMLRESTITICTGPAGTGKTWLVTGIALEKFLNGEVEKIVVTKPILEAGSERIGFLPGLVEDKILPHFQSILDCFEDHLGPTVVKKMLENQSIVFLPTAFCRGRDIKKSFILIDEAQNLTRKGLKLMLTRISSGSIMAVNGDTDQIDIPNEKDSGLIWARNCLIGKNSEINIVDLTVSDIQRHPLLTTIITCLR